VSRVLNLATLLFTIIFSGFLLLYVDWDALTAQVRLRCVVACLSRAAHAASRSVAATLATATLRAWACARAR
jgi:hypothetical protein